jgi:carotenoid isomerooxygenase
MTWCEENVYPSEPIFVPSPDPKVSQYPFTVNSAINYMCRSIKFYSYKVYVYNSCVLFYQEEDDGVVLSALVWGREIEREVGILVLDASTWQELSRANFTTPGPVPKCLHGWFTENTNLTLK